MGQRERDKNNIPLSRNRSPARIVKYESKNVNLIVRVGLKTKKYAGLMYDEVYHLKALNRRFLSVHTPADSSDIRLRR